MTPCQYPRCKSDATMRCGLCSEVACDKHAPFHWILAELAR